MIAKFPKSTLKVKQRKAPNQADGVCFIYVSYVCLIKKLNLDVLPVAKEYRSWSSQHGESEESAAILRAGLPPPPT